MRKRTLSVSSLSVALGAVATLAVTGNPVMAAAPPPVTITGYVEANYTLNFNQPSTDSNTYGFNNMDGQFALNLADLRIARAATDDSRVGFFIRLIEGNVRNQILGSGESVLEAYGTMLVPLKGKDLKVDAGQMVTHIGYETIEVGSDNFFSKSWLFGIPEPLYHVGVRASYPLTPKLTVGGYLYNRFNGTYDTGNRDVAPGFSLAYNPNANCSWIMNGLSSRENIAENVYKQQNILNLIGTKQFGPRFKGVVEGVYRWGDYLAAIDTSEDELPSRADPAGTKTTSYTSYGADLYGIYTLKNADIVALRGDYFSVDKGDTFLLSQPGTDKPYIGSFTASFEPASSLKLFPNLRTILEYRYDFAKENFFVDKDGKAKKNQSTVTIGEVYSF